MRWKEGEHNPIPMISFILYLDSPFSSINSVCALLPPEICGRREGWEGGKERRKERLGGKEGEDESMD